MNRSSHGCWTCRVRHKKCDETTPTCRACNSRKVTCHGYGEKPEWLDGGEQERVEVARIKAEVKANLKRVRRLSQTEKAVRKQERTSPAASAEIELNSETQATDEGDTIPSTVSSDVRQSFNASTPAASFTSQPFQRLHEQPFAHNEALSHNVDTYREAELLMHYIDYIFPLQFRFSVPDIRSGGRGWLFWLLVKTGPLYHAALSLSALHQSVLLGDHGGDMHAELVKYHARALTDLQHFLKEIHDSDKLSDTSQQIKILACGISLISFELFKGGAMDWRPHLNALVSIPVVSDGSAIQSLRSNMIDLRQTIPDLLHWQKAALSFLVPVILWFDLLACVSTGEAPRMPYEQFLAAGWVDLESVMGCQNWVMEIIGDLARLNDWKTRQSQNGMLSVPTLVSQGQKLEQHLESGLNQLETQHLATDQVLGHAKPTPKSLTTRRVTRCFAAGALVLLHTIVSGAYPGLPEIQSAVSRSIDAFRMIDDPQMIRGLIWPVCVSACLAESNKQQFFEQLVESAIGEYRGFGNCESILEIMRACWKTRDKYSNGKSDLRGTMIDLDVCVLLV